MLFIMSSGGISPSSARCMLVGQHAADEVRRLGVIGQRCRDRQRREAGVDEALRMHRSSWPRRGRDRQLAGELGQLDVVLGGRQEGDPPEGRLLVLARREDGVRFVAKIRPAAAIRRARHRHRRDLVAEAPHDLVGGADVVDRHRGATGLEAVDDLPEASVGAEGGTTLCLSARSTKPAIGGQRFLA